MKRKRTKSPVRVALIKRQSESVPRDYRAFLEDLKARIRSAQIRAGLSVNRELIQLYWDIGRAITLKQRSHGWGTKVIDRLAADLQREFPGISGFSRGNVYRMRTFYQAYAIPSPIVAQPARQLTDGTVPQAAGHMERRPIVAQAARQLQYDACIPRLPVAELPWGHNIVLLEALKTTEQRLWYARQAIANGWSRNMLVHWIESDLYSRRWCEAASSIGGKPWEDRLLPDHIIRPGASFGFLISQSIRVDAGNVSAPAE